ncbi:hypothetical protein H0H92_007328 [Tricholoma furcatifolium]|nr:hypothetical protein H0H92_007328 [Tricholoma furcatifolium]
MMRFWSTPLRTLGPLLWTQSKLRPRRIRSRPSSRPSPYLQGRLSRVISSPLAPAAPVLQEVTVKKNIVSTAPYLGALKVFLPPPVDLEPERKKTYGLTGQARIRVGSNVQRNALGLAKRGTDTGSAKRSVDLKEDVVKRQPHVFI